MSFRELTGRAWATFLRTLADTNFTCSSLVLLGRQVCREDTAPGRPLSTGVLARASSGPQLPFPVCAAHTCSHTHTHTITHAHTHNSGSHTHTHTCAHTEHTEDHNQRMLTLTHLPPLILSSHIHTACVHTHIQPLK